MKSFFDANALALAIVAAANVTAAHAAPLVRVTGGLTFRTTAGVNYFDPSAGYVPPVYSNASGINVSVGSGIEYGYSDLANDISVDFSGNRLVLNVLTRTDAYNMYMVFNTNSATFFDNIATAGNQLRLRFTRSSNTLILTIPRIASAGNRTTTFTFGGATGARSAFSPLAAPEPATWAMMIVGFGFVGAALRRSHPSVVAV